MPLENLIPASKSSEIQDIIYTFLKQEIEVNQPALAAAAGKSPTQIANEIKATVIRGFYYPLNDDKTPLVSVYIAESRVISEELAGVRLAHTLHIDLYASSYSTESADKSKLADDRLSYLSNQVLHTLLAEENSPINLGIGENSWKIGKIDKGPASPENNTATTATLRAQFTLNFTTTETSELLANHEIKAFKTTAQPGVVIETENNKGA